jgi:signal transduction histidine kinase
LRIRSTSFPPSTIADDSTLRPSLRPVVGRPGEIASAARVNLVSAARRMRSGRRRATVNSMRARLDALVREPRVQRLGDAVVAFLLAASSVLPVVVKHDPSWGSNEPLAIVIALASTVPVAWRSRWPISAAALVFVANGAALIAAAPHQAAFQPFVALVLVSYSLGSLTSGRVVVPVPLALFGVLAVLGSVAIVRDQQSGNVVPSLLWLAAAWFTGRLMRRWRRRAAELEELTRELEEQRELQAVAAVAVERARIARELHDVIAHNVSMMVVQASAAGRVLEGDQDDVRRALEAVETTGRETVDEMRRLIGVVRNDDGLALAPQPTLADLERLVANVREAGLAVDLQIEGSPVPLPPGVDLSAYRIVQEALTNSVKHAGDARATVVVRYRASAIEVEISDDGDGSGVGGGTGHGLIGMRERVALWGGELEAGRRDGGGFAVRARLPVGA